jgi:flavodoxin
MTSLVVYSSQTGNTRKLAETVRDALPGKTEMAPIEEAPQPEGYDLVAVGFWLQAGKPDPKAAAYLQNVHHVPLLLFATHGAASDSDHARNAMASAADLAPTADLVGTFNCPGEVNPKVLEKIRAKTPPPPWIADADAAVGHPDTEDLARLEDVINALNLQ